MFVAIGALVLALQPRLESLYLLVGSESRLQVLRKLAEKPNQTLIKLLGLDEGLILPTKFPSSENFFGIVGKS